MKALLFHFMNALRVPIMFVTKLLLWLLVPMTLLMWSEHLGVTELGIWKEMADKLFAGSIIFSVLWAGIYYFRWKYDILLVRLNPTKQGVAVSQGDSHIFGAGGNDSAIIGKE